MAITAHEAIYIKLAKTKESAGQSARFVLTYIEVEGLNISAANPKQRAGEDCPAWLCIARIARMFYRRDEGAS